QPGRRVSEPWHERSVEGMRARQVVHGEEDVVHSARRRDGRHGRWTSAALDRLIGHRPKLARPANACRAGQPNRAPRPSTWAWRAHARARKEHAGRSTMDIRIEVNGGASSLQAYLEYVRRRFVAVHIAAARYLGLGEADLRERLSAGDSLGDLADFQGRG